MFKVLKAEAGTAGRIDLYERETPSASGFVQTALVAAAASTPPDAGNVAGLAGSGNAIDCAGIGRETMVPVTGSGSTTFVGMTVATGFWTVVRPSVKLIIPTATATAPAAAKNVILRITPFLNAPRVTFVRNWLTSSSWGGPTEWHALRWEYCMCRKLKFGRSGPAL